MLKEGQERNAKLVAAAIDESHKNNLPVAVHATERITAQLAVEAGADYLVHDVDNEVVKDSFVQLLKNKHTVLCPTLVVALNYGKVFSKTYKFTDDEKKYSDSEQVATIENFPQPDTVLGKRLIASIKTGRSWHDKPKPIPSLLSILKNLLMQE